MARYKVYKGKLRGRSLTTFTQDEVGKGCLIIIWTGLNIKTGIAQKVYEL